MTDNEGCELQNFSPDERLLAARPAEGRCRLVAIGDSNPVEPEGDRRPPGAAYSSNIEPRTFPDGLDVEAVRAATLREIDAELEAPDLREHVTLAIRRDPLRWPRASVTHEPDLGLLRWTIDTASDLDFVRAVVKRLGPRRYAAGLDEILEAVRRAPSLSDGGLRG